MEHALGRYAVAKAELEDAVDKGLECLRRRRTARRPAPHEALLQSSLTSRSALPEPPSPSGSVKGDLFGPSLKQSKHQCDGTRGGPHGHRRRVGHSPSPDHRLTTWTQTAAQVARGNIAPADRQHVALWLGRFGAVRRGLRPRGAHRVALRRRRARAHRGPGPSGRAGRYGQGAEPQAAGQDRPHRRVRSLRELLAMGRLPESCIPPRTSSRSGPRRGSTRRWPTSARGGCKGSEPPSSIRVPALASHLLDAEGQSHLEQAALSRSGWSPSSRPPSDRAPRHRARLPPRGVGGLRQPSDRLPGPAVSLRDRCSALGGHLGGDGLLPAFRLLLDAVRHAGLDVTVWASDSERAQGHPPGRARAFCAGRSMRPGAPGPRAPLGPRLLPRGLVRPALPGPPFRSDESSHGAVITRSGRRRRPGGGLINVSRMADVACLLCRPAPEELRPPGPRPGRPEINERPQLPALGSTHRSSCDRSPVSEHRDKSGRPAATRERRAARPLTFGGDHRVTQRLLPPASPTDVSVAGGYTDDDERSVRSTFGWWSPWLTRNLPLASPTDKWQQQERRAGARVVIVHGVQTPLDTRGEGHLPAPQAPTPRSQISFSPGSGVDQKSPG